MMSMGLTVPGAGCRGGDEEYLRFRSARGGDVSLSDNPRLELPRGGEECAKCARGGVASAGDICVGESVGSWCVTMRSRTAPSGITETSPEVAELMVRSRPLALRNMFLTLFLREFPRARTAFSTSLEEGISYMPNASEGIVGL